MLTQIHSRPRTYLIPHQYQTDKPPDGRLNWLLPVFRISNYDLAHKCGMDAYLFLRYLRMLLKIFVPAAILINAVLVPLNKINGRGANFATGIYGNSTTYNNVTGLDEFAWGNVRPTRNNRYWAHLVLAVILVTYVCFVFYDELQGFVRLRQAYLTSPQHRIRAAATTVLVTNIPEEWRTVQALDNLFDAFPGGVRNIWINRNYETLHAKIKERNALVNQIELAYTKFIQKSRKAYLKSIKNTDEPNKVLQCYNKTSKANAERRRAKEAAANETAEDVGVVPHTVTEGGQPPEQSQVITEDTQSQEEPKGGARDSARLNPGKAIDAQVPKVPETTADIVNFSDSFTATANASIFPPVPFNPSASPAVRTNTAVTSTGSTNTPTNPTNTSGFPTRPPSEEDNDDGEPLSKQFVSEKDRDTMRLPLFGLDWMPVLPLLGKKVDVVEHCRKELAALNLVIEAEQREPEKFPLLNSAFIQFNNQVAAHMACQSVSHHLPHQMTPRLVEISSIDVIWDNLSIKWWDSYLRAATVAIFIILMTFGWAIPVTLTGLLSQVHYLSEVFTWLGFLKRTPVSMIALMQGVLPQALLGFLLYMVPVILRRLLRFQGYPTGAAVEQSLQNYYFFFLFVQVFLVVSISSGITTVIQQVTESPQSVPSILAQNLPKASNYFFSYLVLQTMSVGSAALLQIFPLVRFHVAAPFCDITARKKFSMHNALPAISWGSFFPVYTNLAAIGLIYAVISPLILFFCVVTFAFFWVVYRYNTLYVNVFRFDTGGLVFPKAITQLFTGLYVMELSLIGLFLLVRDVDSNGNAVGTPCKGQAIVMIIVFIGTIIFQWFLNASFNPLITYLPVSLEDEAFERDELFALQDEGRKRTRGNHDTEEDDFARRRRSLERHKESFAEGFCYLHNGARLCSAMGQLDMEKKVAKAAESDSDSSPDSFGESTTSAKVRDADSEGTSHNRLGKRAHGLVDPGCRQNTSDTKLYGVSVSDDRQRRNRRREYYQHLQERQRHVVEDHRKGLEARKEILNVGAGGMGFDGQDEREDLEKPSHGSTVISENDNDTGSVIVRPQDPTSRSKTAFLQNLIIKPREALHTSVDLHGSYQSHEDEDSLGEAIDRGFRPLSVAMGHADRSTNSTVATSPAPRKLGWAEQSRRDWAARSHRFPTPYNIRGRKHTRLPTDLEAQTSGRAGHDLFVTLKGDLEDLTVDERDRLAHRAFQHEALRSRRPIIWIPKDELGISDREVLQCQNFSKHIWISNEFTAFDYEGRVLFTRGPPDEDEVEFFDV